MTAAELTAWREKHQMPKTVAAEALGIGLRSLQAYEAGRQAVPKYLALACIGWDATHKRKRTLAQDMERRARLAEG